MKSRQQRANLRCCASCEWIYLGAEKPCPKCGFASYGALYVYGKKAYRYAVTQGPWKDKKMTAHEAQLDREIADWQRATKLPGILLKGVHR